MRTMKTTRPRLNVVVGADAIAQCGYIVQCSNLRFIFRGVVVAEAQAVADEVNKGAESAASPFDALEAGAESYFEAMVEPGRARLLLVEGPAVLGLDQMAAIDDEAGTQTLRLGLAAALHDGIDPAELECLASMLSAAFDRAALHLTQGAGIESIRAATTRILAGLLPKGGSAD